MTILKSLLKTCYNPGLDNYAAPDSNNKEAVERDKFIEDVGVKRTKAEAKVLIDAK